MVKRQKSGFTLVELLGVIVVIGVIAVITVPLVNRMIVNSRMSALKSSAEALLKETTLQSAMQKVDSNAQILITDERLKLKNNQFTSGFIYKNSDGKLVLKNVTNGTFCVNGTSGNLNVAKGNCVSNDKTAPTLTVQNGYVGATEIMVLAQATDNESGIKGYEYKIGSGSYTKMQSDNFYQFEGLTKNTSYTITVRVTNGAGLTTQKSITVKTKTTSAATFVVSDANKWTNKKDVTIKYPTRVSGVTYRYKIGSGAWQTLTSGTKKELEVKENTTIYADIILKGETTSSSVSITKIDNTAPVITSVTPNTTSWARQVTIQVVASDTPSGIAGYSFNDGATWTNASTYTTMKNGTYKIKVKDYANNITSKSITIKNIDRIGPKCKSSGGNNTWTNVSRTIYGTCIDDGEGAGCVTEKISKTITTDTNAKLSPGSVRDEAGNETECPATEMVRVDKTKPTCEVTGIKGWTNKPVTVYGKCKDSLSGCVTGNLKKTYSTQMNEKVTLGTLRDKAGNESTCTSTVNVQIDTTAPTCSVSGGSTSWTNGSRTVTGTCNDTGGSGCKGNISYTYNGTSGQNYSITNAGAAGAEKGGTVSDNAGNTANCAANQTVRIDKKAPTCSVSGGSTSWTNGSRTVTGTCNDTGGSGCKGNISYTYNGTSGQNYSITNAGAAGAEKGGTVSDNAGNTANCAANQTVRIDKKAPTCVSSGGNPNWIYGGSVTLTGTCSDIAGSECKGNVTRTITTPMDSSQVSPGSVYDNVGNKTDCPANQHVHIADKLEAPIISNPTGGNWVNYDFSLDVKTPNNNVKVAYWQWRYANTGWNTYSNSAKNQFTTTPYSAERNELTYTRYCVSDSKCSPEASTTIRIDKTAPSITVSDRIMGPSPSNSGHKCYINLYYEDWGSGLHYRDITGNVTFPRANLIGNYTTKGGPIDYIGLFSVNPVRYDVTVCDIANNCSSQSGTKY